MHEKIFELDEFLKRGYASIEELNRILNELSFSRLDDSDLATISGNLLKFPTIIDEVARNPSYYKAGFDLAAYYHAVKGKLTPKLVDSHVQRLTRFRGRLSRYAESHNKLAKKPHEIKEYPSYGMDVVKGHFGGLDVYDGRRFHAVLDGITLIFHCPEIVPNNAIAAFRNRWYTAKQFHGNYEWGIKTVDELKEDGRKNIFLEGVGNLVHYLHTR